MMKKITLLALLAVAFGFSANAQSSATATATATFVTPISISKVADMDFKTLAASGTVGTAVLTPAGALSRTGGVTIVSGIPTAAKFTVTGNGTATYAITLPTSITLDDGASHTLTLGSFTSTPSGTGTLASGTQDITVGATLQVGTGVVAGTYTNSTDLTVTVNYN